MLIPILDHMATCSLLKPYPTPQYGIHLDERFVSLANNLGITMGSTIGLCSSSIFEGSVLRSAKSKRRNKGFKAFECAEFKSGLVVGHGLR